MPSQAAQPTPARPASGKRLAWLDALRGITALCVVFDHLTYTVFQSARTTVCLVSCSVYLLHPALLEIYSSVPWTQGENFVPTELLMVAVFMVVLLAAAR